MTGHEVIRVGSYDIQKAMADEASRPKLVESLPDWMKRDTAHVRYAGHEIEFDDASLPRLDGIMGAVRLLRRGEAELAHAPAHRLQAPHSDNKESWALIAKIALETIGLGASAAAVKKGKHSGNGILMGLGLIGGLTSGIAFTLDLTGCGPQSEVPTAIATEVPSTPIPSTELPVQLTMTPLSNEVVVGTPSSVPETPAPVISASYPSEVINLESPLVYSYGGETGRQNMDEYTRQMFDRYIAEMGPNRGGYLVGATVEELYRSFDQGYDFKLYTTDKGLTWLVQSKSDGSFLVPKDQNGQIFRDLQLPYDYLFQSGAAVGVGTDNFDFQRFQANKVGFVGAWPVLVNVDSQDIPVSWANMEQSGSTNPITVASTAEAPTEVVAVPTESGPKNGETKIVKENEHEYKYTYNSELGKWVREIAKFPLLDGPKYGFVIFTVSTYEDVDGERSFFTVKHPDVVDNKDLAQFQSTFIPELGQRYFNLDNMSVATNDQYVAMQMEMIKGQDSTATVPFIVANGTPEGKTLQVKLSTETGINVMIMDPETIMALGGKDVIKLNDGNVTFYIQAYDVDDNGNALYRLAFEGSLDSVPDKEIMDILFMIAANFTEYPDARHQGFTPIAQSFVRYAQMPRANGEPDYSVERVHAPQP